MTTNTLVDGQLQEPAYQDRPSGLKLAIFDLPRTEVPVAPFTLARFRVPPGVTSAADHHEVREIWLIQSGSGELSLDERKFRVSAGDTLYFESFRTHQLHNDGDEPVDVVSIWWQP
jgi:mannose-6-phosphate isomerase-like protein (cupin superfamily)